MKLSIITVNLNNAQGLQKTIESVLSQTWQDYEFIIVDGASTDGSLDILKKHPTIQQFNSSTVRQFKWISDPDKGIYCGMNKGISIATGEYLHFLNSGDFLVDDLVYDGIFNNDVSADIIYGNRIDVYPDGKEILNRGIATSNVTFRNVYDGKIPHSCSFIKQDLFVKYGYYDEEFRIASDTEFFLKVIGLHQCSVKYIDTAISKFGMDGISKDPELQELRLAELEKARQNVMSPTLVNAYNFYLKYNLVLKYIINNKLTWIVFKIISRLARVFRRTTK